MEVRYFEFGAPDPESLALSKGPAKDPPVDDKAPHARPVKFVPPPPGNVEPIFYEFVMAQPHLSVRMERVVREVFALYGNAGLERLRGAFTLPPVGPSMPTGSALAGTVYEHSLALRSEFESQYAALRKMLQPALAAIQRKAAALALAAVKDAQLTVDAERKRYLDPKASIFDRALVLAGPDAAGLARALIEIDARARRLKAIESELHEVDEARRRVIRNMIKTYSMIDMRNVKRRGQPAPDPRLAAASNAVVLAQDQLTRARTAFLSWLGAKCMRYPILYRIWNAPELTAEIAEIRRKVQGIEDPARRAQAILDLLQRSRPLARQVADCLQTIGGAAAAVRQRIERQKHEFDVWRYSPLVVQAMEQLAVPVSTVEWWAANDKIAMAGSSWISDLSIAVSVMEQGAAVVGAAPPVLLAAAVVSLIVSTVEALHERWKYEEDRDVFNSTFDPARSFAAEQSAVWSIVSLACLVLQAGDLRVLARERG